VASNAREEGRGKRNGKSFDAKGAKLSAEVRKGFLGDMWAVVGGGDVVAVAAF
jgi:hypothetical protein